MICDPVRTSDPEPGSCELGMSRLRDIATNNTSGVRIKEIILILNNQEVV